MTADQVPVLIIEAYGNFGINVEPNSWLYLGTIIVLLFLLGRLTLFICRQLLVSRFTRLISLSKNKWDDELHDHHFFKRCAHIATAILLYLVLPILLPEQKDALAFLQKVIVVYVLLASIGVFSALFNTIEDMYNASDLARRAPITGFVQVGKLLVVIVVILLVIANLLDKSPLLLLSGLGAVTAILLLVFKDTILGFVAGIQIAANRMVNNGDWIEMPKYNADGEVMQVGLTTVKVRNWDKTISTIPTYALISEPVKNWRGMSESDGRRIKRSLFIDMKSIRFCTEDDLQNYTNIRYISEYIAQKRLELAEYHQDQQISNDDLLNSRRMTNVGTLRAYMEAYLRNHPKVNQNMTLMVRQLPPSPTGVGIEVYCFSANKEWIAYEGIQADIFDHFMAMLPVFDLRPYQRISDRADW